MKRHSGRWGWTNCVGREGEKTLGSLGESDTASGRQDEARKVSNLDRVFLVGVEDSLGAVKKENSEGTDDE